MGLLLRRGRVAFASIVFSSLTWLVVTMSVVAYGSVVSPGLLNYFGTIAIVGLLLGGRAALGFAGLTILATAGAVYAEHTNRLPVPLLPTSPPIMGWIASLNFVVTALAIHLALRNVTESLTRARTELAERRRAEENLRASEERFRVMIENISDAIALVNAQGVVHYLSPAAERILGYTTAERIGQQALDNIAEPAEVARLQRMFDELVAEPQASRTSEFQARHKDGCVRWLEATATNRLDLACVQSVIVSYRDITERKRSELALRESEQSTRRFKEYLEVLHSVNIELGSAVSLDDLCRRAVELGRSQLEFDRLGIWLYESDTQTLHGTFGTDAAGQTSDERGMVLMLEECPTAIPILTGSRQSVLTDPAMVRSASGEELAMGWSAKAVLWHGEQVIGFISADNGVHHEPIHSYQLELLSIYGTTLGHLYNRKQAEETHTKLEAQLHHAQKMESIGQLAGGIAHDFNNLLTVIRGYCDIIQDALSREDPLHAELTHIRSASERATILIRQLLAFSRRQILVPTVLDLNSLVENLRTLLERLISEDITLVTLLSPGLRSIIADPSQIEQVVMNLVVNARDAMPTGGRLTIETANIDLDNSYASTHPEAPIGPCVVLAVTDTGYGMDASTRARIFEPFFTTKEPGKGTGLGLATIYGIVKQSGGEITVYSQPGQGTTFQIYLPASAIASSDRAAPKPGPVTYGGSETILLAEDEESVRNLASTALRAHGYTVLEARNGSEALSLAEQYQQPIDLLVTDVVMPQMSGRVLAEQLTSLRPMLKVLFMSGYMDDVIVRHGVLAAEVEFLPKPFSPSVLVAKVREVLDAANSFSRSTA
jgi:PAS domain S-box-containing protein